MGNRGGEGRGDRFRAFSCLEKPRFAKTTPVPHATVAYSSRPSVSIIHLTNRGLSFAKLVSFGDKENAKVTH